MDVIAHPVDSLLWFGKVDMASGKRTASVITLYDAYFPAVLALSGDLGSAAKSQEAFHQVWTGFGLEPMVYDYQEKEILNPSYNLNPEIIESAYYLYYFTGEDKYKDMVRQYFNDLMKWCRTDIAFTCIQDVRTKEQKDHMETFFLAETMKYFYLAFADQEMYNLETAVFSTGAHPFMKAALDPVKIRENLDLTR